jgi:hypothetical protein
MTNHINKKQDSKKTDDKSNLNQAGDKVTKAAGDVFEKLKEHFEPEKVDAWQKEWLGMPEKRKKYEKISDTPEVVGEELIAMSNDIIDFIQGQKGGKSNIFKKIKTAGTSFFKNPAKFIDQTVNKGKKAVGEVTNQAKEAGKKTTKETKKPVEKKVEKKVSKGSVKKEKK